MNERSKKAECTRNDQTIVLNKTGEQGPKGEKGDKGDVGPQGPKGDTGLQGLKGEDGKSIEMLPEDLRPTIKNIKICRNNQDVNILWDLSNKYDDIVINSGNVKGTGISWGSIYVKTESGAVTKSRIHNVYGIGFDFPGWDISSQKTAEFTFNGGVKWEDFIIPININSVIPVANSCSQYSI
jgi:hypothetical protein